MKGLNRTIIAGNLARDPEVRYTVNKRAWARFSVAVNYRYKDNNGEYKDGVDYIPIVVWGAQGENCGKYLKKGSPVLIEGRITTRSYEANDGSGKRYSTEINADNVIFLSSGQNNTGGYSSYSPMAPGSPADDEFGKPIGESGFSGGGFAGNFASTNEDSNGMSEDNIPF